MTFPSHTDTALHTFRTWSCAAEDFALQSSFQWDSFEMSSYKKLFCDSNFDLVADLAAEQRLLLASPPVFRARARIAGLDTGSSERLGLQ